MPGFESILQSIAKQPATYVGRCSLWSVGHYLQGYDHALADAGQSVTPLAGWGRWVESRYLISHSEWPWTRILLHVFGSDRAAIDALPQLYTEFLAQRQRVGVDGIERAHQQKFMAEYGQDWYAPPNTWTNRPQ